MPVQEQLVSRQPAQYARAGEHVLILSTHVPEQLKLQALSKHSFYLKPCDSERERTDLEYTCTWTAQITGTF